MRICIRVLSRLTCTTVALAAGAAARAQTAQSIPISGDAVPGMISFDQVVTSLMRTYSIPGGAVGVVKDGRLVYARGFGWADVERRVQAEPTSLFRIASLSKAITSAAIMKLVEASKLKLSDRAFSYLTDLTPPPNTGRDPRLDQITIENLLQHSGGWDRDKTFDPMFISTRAANAVGAPRPASATTVIRYMLGQPLQFDPGTKYNYSNFGYDVLGRIIERVTGLSYESFVRSAVLAPSGAMGIRQGRTHLSDRAPGEVVYYAIGGDPFGVPRVNSVFPGEGQVPETYGGFNVEAMDAHGAWISSAVDLLKFITAVDGLPSRPDILTPESIKRMTARPNNPVWATTDNWYADGWMVRPAGKDFNWWHTGSLPGTTTLMVRANNGLAWVALFNARAKDNAGFTAALDRGLWTAVAGVTSWPANDLFGRY